jgi:hypothetical protein
VRADEKLDDELRAQLDRVGDDDPIDVLVQPAADPFDLEADLAGRASEGVRYNVLPLHGSIALRAPKPVILELAARADVARVTAMPRAGIT